MEAAELTFMFDSWDRQIFCSLPQDFTRLCIPKVHPVSTNKKLRVDKQTTKRAGHWSCCWFLRNTKFRTEVSLCHLSKTFVSKGGPVFEGTHITPAFQDTDLDQDHHMRRNDSYLKISCKIKISWFTLRECVVQDSQLLPHQIWAQNLYNWLLYLYCLS